MVVASLPESFYQQFGPWFVRSLMLVTAGLIIWKTAQLIKQFRESELFRTYLTGTTDTKPQEPAMHETDAEDQMQPSDCSKYLFHHAQHPPNLPITVREAFDVLHRLKMRTDEPSISRQCQELINILFKKYPGVVACPE